LSENPEFMCTTFRDR